LMVKWRRTDSYINNFLQWFIMTIALFVDDGHLLIGYLSLLLFSSSLSIGVSATDNLLPSNNSTLSLHDEAFYLQHPSLSSENTTSALLLRLHDDPISTIDSDQHILVDARVGASHVPVALYICVSLLIVAALFAIVSMTIVYHQRRRACNHHRFPDSSAFYANDDNESRAWDSLSFVSCVAETNVAKLQSWESLSDDSYLTSLDAAIRASIISAAEHRSSTGSRRSNGANSSIGVYPQFTVATNNNASRSIVYSLPDPIDERSDRINHRIL